MRHWALSLMFLVALGLLGSSRAWAQASTLDDGPPPPPGAEPAPPTPPPPASAPSAHAAAAAAPEAPAPPAEPVWDPLRASKSMEVGAYYLKTGNYDAAIDRLQEAARVQPGLAKPYLLLAKAYEKKKDAKSAVSAYQKYLQLYPTAPDREEVVKQIAKQNGLIPKSTKQSALR